MSALPGNRVAGLDLLRGLAILLVLVRHGFSHLMPSAGIVGVVIFFTLSGYLITGVLHRDITRYGRVRYGHFYRNRALRLIPALVLVVATFAVVEALTNILGDRDIVVRSVIVALTYTADVPIHNSISVGLSHLWTLAVEEQFYLLWPLVLVWAIRARRMKSMFLGGAVIALTVSGLTIMLVHSNVAQVYRLPTSWTIAILIGAAAYVWRERLFSLLTNRLAPFAAAAGLAALLALSFLPINSNSNPLLYLLGAPAIAISTVALIIYLSAWKSVPSRAFAPLLFLGTISYGAYLWNYLITNWLGVEKAPAWVGALSIVLTVIAATASWYLVEKRVLSLKDKLDARSARLADKRTSLRSEVASPDTLA
jgi:peptidoglycan/LPS O-acetylase OafA/YrhL